LGLYLFILWVANEHVLQVQGIAAFAHLYRIFFTVLLNKPTPADIGCQGNNPGQTQ